MRYDHKCINYSDNAVMTHLMRAAADDLGRYPECNVLRMLNHALDDVIGRYVTDEQVVVVVAAVTS